ncbi:unnamed protein product [Nezara viridula]|uniref:fructose-bisphosphatase n=1 Tax=Nezara viridula TaxID=85310 RepID=A0A9P0HTR7_NEZVI|nr:unnamed protein product [Nezara viridula]
MFCFNELEKLIKTIPCKEETKNVETLSSYVLRQNLAVGELFCFIHAIELVIKALSSKITRYNFLNFSERHVRKGKTEEKPTDPLETLFSSITRKLQFIKILEEMVIHVIGDSGLVQYMISKYTEDIMKVECHLPGKYVACFNVLDGRKNLADHLPVGATFALYKLKQEGDLDLATLTGNSITIAGYAIFGTCTKLVLGFNARGVHDFYLDRSLGEFILKESDKIIPKRGVCYSANEGITAGWDEATLIYSNRRKDPRFLLQTHCYHLGTFSADVSKILNEGGIYMYPANITHPEGKIHLLYEANPMGYILREAGGYATDGFTSILNIEPRTHHQRIPFFGGSIEDVISIMELKTIYKARKLK